MTTVLVGSISDVPVHQLAILWPESGRVTGEYFFEFCQLNRDLRIERSSKGVILITPPTGGETGNRNVKITVQLGQWAERDGTGEAFDSSTGFELPSSAVRSPDAAWVLRSRLAQLTSEQKKKFLPLCPDFVIELRSPSDHLEDLQAKMNEYIENGCRLGWLIDPETRRVYVYEPGGSSVISNPQTILADPVLPGFTLDLAAIWNPAI